MVLEAGTMAFSVTIDRIETFTRNPLSIVRIRTGDGLEGIGQIAPFNANISALVLHQQIAPLVLGREITDIGSLAGSCVESQHKFPWSYVCRAVGGLETALWDLRGKLEGKSVCALLGGELKPIDVYGSSMRRDIAPTEEAERLAKLRDRYGFRAFKVRVGKVCGHDEDQWPGRTEELIPTVRRALGRDIELLVDANSCYTPGRAFAVGKLLEEWGYCHFEEPCPYWELEWTAEVARELEIDVTGGEQDVDLAQWRRMIRMRAVDILQPDICYIGGLSRALEVAAMGREAQLRVVPHSANLSMVAVFTIHLMNALSNAGPYMEYTIEASSWTDGLYRPALRIDDGRVALSERPGWAVEIDPDWMAEAERRISSTD
jgi:L-alanine-DL-glutamate epimerase-like enolase superfamily enzyme